MCIAASIACDSSHQVDAWEAMLPQVRQQQHSLAQHSVTLQVRKLFQQLFSFVNVQLFNQLLLRRECCSFSNGEYVKTGLAEVENWIHTAGKDWTGESWDELRYIRQVCIAFLLLGVYCQAAQFCVC